MLTDKVKVYDVAILGAGLNGFAAAVACSKAGHQVILVERRPVLGWESTGAFRLDARDLPDSLDKELRSKLSATGGMHKGRLDAPIFEMILDRYAHDLGVDVLLYSQPVAIQVKDELVCAVTTASKAGEFPLRAKAFVDATDQGLLWRFTGVEFSEPKKPEAMQVIFLNGTGPLAEERCIDSSSVTIQAKPGVWHGEIALEFEVPCPDIRIARRMVPEVLSAARENMPELANALVTHVGCEPFPLYSPSPKADSSVRHPHLSNLFGAGPWSDQDAAERIADWVNDLAQPRAVDDTAKAVSVIPPPIFSSDVLVCGGGTAGALAAIAAGRQGVNTTLIEPTTFLGGIGSGGGIHSYYHGVTGGIQDEVDERVEQLSPLFGPNQRVRGFHPETKKVVLQQMADEAGVKLVFDTVVTGVETEEIAEKLPATGKERPRKRITGVVTAGPNANAVYHAKVVIDSTGDGDVAVMAGAPYTFGRETDNLPHAFSLAAGRLDHESKLLITNFDAGYCDPTDVVDLTRARRLGLQHYWQDTVTAENRLVYIAPLIGLRNSRQVLGDYILTLSDEVAGRNFPDVIAYAYSHFDNHGFDYENESDQAMVWVWVLGNWQKQFGCEIPYRCLLPRDLEGILIACRAISITHDAHNQLRMQRDMQRIGEAAGTAAALAVKDDVTPRAVDVRVVQAELFKSGALGPRRKPELPPPAEVQIHDETWKPSLLPARPAAEWIAELGKEKPQQAVWHLIDAGRDALPLLQQELKSGHPQQRFWASVCLAMLGQTEAEPELLSCVKERRSDVPEGGRTVPLWQSSVALLGMIGSTSAVPAIAEILKDPGAELDCLITVVRALRKINDSTAIPAIEEMLKRDDLPVARTFQVSMAGKDAIVEDARWQLELAAAESLACLGKPRPDLIEKHSTDPRAYVRRYADKVQRMQTDWAGG